MATTEDVSTHRPATRREPSRTPSQHTAPRRRSARRRSWDRVLMADPGLVKTAGALRTLVCIPGGMAVGYAIASAVGLPAVLGLMIGAMPAFITCLVIVDPSPGRVAGRTGAVIVAFVVALGASIALHPYRLLELALIVVLLFAQFAATQFAAWWSDAAMVGFAGYLCGLLLPLPETSVPVLAAIAAASLAVTIVLRTLFFRPRPYRSLLRTRRAFLGWGSAVLEASVHLLAVADDDRARARALRRLRRRRDRFHEVALTVDGMLGASGAGPTGQAADELHRLVFDTHLAIDELGRGAEAVVESGADEHVRHAVLRAFTIVLRHGGSAGADAARTLVARAGAGGPEHASAAAPTAPPSDASADERARVTHLVHRLGLQFTDLRTAGARWRAVRDELPRGGAAVPFATPVVLAGGRPAGAVPVFADTLAEGVRGPWRRWHITAAWRTAIHAAIAVAITEPLALLLDGSRFYWGVIGVMIVLAGTNTTDERIRKGLHRGVGTVVGGAVGIVLVHVLGTTHPWATIVLVCVLLAVGTYGFGGVYSLWVTCLVIVLCQVYAYSGSFTDTLIPARLAENLLGAAIGILVSALVLPVATHAVVRSAVRRQLAAARAFVLAAVGLDPDDDGSGAADGTTASRPAADTDDAAVLDLRARSRALDAATYQLDAVLKPMVRFPTGGPAKADAHTRASLQAVATFARELAGRPEPGPDSVPAGLVEAATVLATSIDALSGRIGSTVPRARAAAPGPRRGARPDAAWVRVADLLDDVDREAPPGPAGDRLRERVHALGRIDESLALLAGRSGMTVTGTGSVVDAPTERARRASAMLERRLS